MPILHPLAMSRRVSGEALLLAALSGVISCQSMFVLIAAPSVLKHIPIQTLLPPAEVGYPRMHVCLKVFTPAFVTLTRFPVV